MALRRGTWRGLLVVVALVALLAVAMLLRPSRDDSPEVTRSDVSELPFWARGPMGRETTGKRVQVEAGSEVLAIIGEHDSYEVVLRIVSDPESVIDAYAEQLGCPPQPELGDPACKRPSPLEFELVGLAGADYYSLHAGRAEDGDSWIAVFTWASGR